MSAENETRKHILEVNRRMGCAVKDLINRMTYHDSSKLKEPEANIFEIYTEKLRGMTYGSEEYKKCLKEMEPALKHHYEVNRHHPEYHVNGINGMCLLDLIEMLCDWKAATLRHADGDILKSIEINQKRFGYSDELKQILLNTLPHINIIGIPEDRHE